MGLAHRIIRVGCHVRHHSDKDASFVLVAPSAMLLHVGALLGIIVL